MYRSYALAAQTAPEPACADFLADCLHGLAQPQKSLPCKWLYDDRGSNLFEAICRTPEYYPSRTEAALLADAAAWLAGQVAPGTALIEYGSGASRKTRLLLDAVPAIASYAPIDISEAELGRAAAAIAASYPALALYPLLGDFTETLRFDPALDRQPRLGFFPGSTLGNFAPGDAVAFLRSAREMMGQGSRLLLGVDLRKDAEILIPAYDDAAGVTADFNRNLLVRMQRELGCAIDVDAFAHRAVWNDAASRIEMHLVSLCDQAIMLDGRRIAFAAGETIHTENSHKFGLLQLTAMFHDAGWTVERQWISPTPSYALILLSC